MSRPVDLPAGSAASLTILEFFALLQDVADRSASLGRFGSTSAAFPQLLALARIASAGETNTDLRDVALLECEGLVRRVAGDAIVLTEDGKGALDSLITDILPAVTNLAKSASAPDMIDTLPLLRRIVAYLDRIEPGDGEMPRH